MSRLFNTFRFSDSIWLWAVCGLIAVSLTQGSGNHNGLARGAICVACYEADTGRFPIRGSLYEMTNPPVLFQGSQLPIPIELLQLQLQSVPPLTGVLPPPGTSSTVDSFFDITYRVGPSGGPYHVDSFFDVFTEINLSTDRRNSAIGDVRTELLSMNLQGQFPSPTGPIRFLVRESPVLSSNGQHSYSEHPSGGFEVNSFFDIFTELSIDGGQTWIPSSGPAHMELTRVGVPEPGSLMLAVFVGLTGLAVRLRRRWR
jgi:hypothetical protein